MHRPLMPINLSEITSFGVIAGISSALDGVGNHIAIENYIGDLKGARKAFVDGTAPERYLNVCERFLAAAYLSHIEDFPTDYGESISPEAKERLYSVLLRNAAEQLSRLPPTSIKMYDRSVPENRWIAVNAPLLTIVELQRILEDIQTGIAEEGMYLNLRFDTYSSAYILGPEYPTRFMNPNWDVSIHYDKEADIDALSILLEKCAKMSVRARVLALKSAMAKPPEAVEFTLEQLDYDCNITRNEVDVICQSISRINQKIGQNCDFECAGMQYFSELKILHDLKKKTKIQ